MGSCFGPLVSLLQGPDEQAVSSVLLDDVVGLAERKVQRKKSSCGMRYLCKLNLKRERAADADGAAI